MAKKIPTILTADDLKKLAAKVTTPTTIANATQKAIQTATGAKASAPVSASANKVTTANPLNTIKALTEAAAGINPLSPVSKVAANNARYGVEEYGSAYNTFLSGLMKLAESNPGKDVADLLKSDELVSMRQLGFKNWNDDTAKAALMGRDEFIDAFRKNGFFNKPEFLTGDYISMTDLAYLTEQQPLIAAQLEESKKKDDAAKLFESNLQSTRGAWEQLEAESKNPYMFDPMYGYAMMEYLQGDRTDPFNYDEWDYQYQSLTPEEQQTRLAGLQNQWNGLDFDTLTGRNYKPYESATPGLQSQYDVVTGEIDRRSARAAKSEELRNSPNYGKPYTPVEGEKGTMIAPGVDGQARLFHYDSNAYDLQYLINTHGGEKLFQQLEDGNPIAKYYDDHGLFLMTDQEILEYNTAVYDGGEEGGKAYLELILPDVHARKNDFTEQYFGSMSTDPFGAVMMEVARPYMNMLGSAGAVAGAMLGVEDPYDPVYGYANMGNTISEELGQTAGELIPFEFLGQKFGTTLYNIFASIHDMKTAKSIGTLFGSAADSTEVAKKVMGIVMSTQSGTNTYMSDLKEGKDPLYSALHGMADGSVEYLSESGFIDSLFSEDGKFLTRVWNSAMSEGLEEDFSQGMQMGVDIFMSWVTGQKSDVEKTYEYYAKTVGKDKAAMATMQHYAQEFALAYLTGAAIGGGTSAVVNTEAAIANTQYGKEVRKNGDPDRILSIAAGMAEGTESKRIADEVTARVEKKPNKGITNYELGQLTGALARDLGDEKSKALDKVQDKAIADRLMELGDDQQTAEKNAPAIRKLTRGQKLTLQERAAVDWNDNMNQVVRELSRETEIEDSDRTGNKWVAGMKAAQIDATGEVYGKQIQLQQAMHSPSVSKVAERAAEKAQAKVQKKGGKFAGKPTSTHVSYTDTETGKGAAGDLLRLEQTEDGLKAVIQQDGTKDKDGEKTVSLADIDIADGEGIQEIIEYVTDENLPHEVTAEEANALMQSYKASGGGKATTFIEAFEGSYLRGYSGLADNARVLDPTLSKIAYEHGKAEAEKDEQTRKTRASSYKALANPKAGWLGKVNSRTQLKGLGDVDGLEAHLQALPESQRVAAEILIENGKALGLNVVMYDSQGEGMADLPNGAFDELTHTVYYDVSSGAITPKDVQAMKEKGTLGYALLRVGGHELTHYLEVASPEMYAKYKDAIRKAYTSKGVDMSVLIRNRLDKAQEKGQKMTYAQAVAEVVADASEQMLRDSKFTNDLDPTLKGKIKEFIQHFSAKIREIFAHLTGWHEESEALMETVNGVKKYMKGLQNLWDAGFEEILAKGTEDLSGETAEAVEEQGLKNSERDVERKETNKFYGMPFDDQVRALLNGEMRGDGMLLLGRTPEVLRNIGLSDLPMMMDMNHARKLREGTTSSTNDDHILSWKTIRELPNLIADPVAVVLSPDPKYRGKTVNVIVAAENKNGRQIYAAIALDATVSVPGGMADVNKASTVFGSDKVIQMLDDAVLATALGGKEVLYINNKKAAPLYRISSNLKAGGKIGDGLINTIADADIPVNSKGKKQTDTQQFRRWFGNSQVVNEDGTPKVLYHQTEDEFYVFDTRHKGAGTRDNETPFGIFMKTTNRDIGVKGSRQMALYAKIVNPLRVQNRSELVWKLQQLSPEYARLKMRANEIDAEYAAKTKEAQEALKNYLIQLRENEKASGTEPKSRKDLYADPDFMKVFNAEDEIVDEWIETASANDLLAKETITKALKEAGYDGIILKEDRGSWGRSTDAYIALDPEQVKSATDNVGTFDQENPDIRYSERDTEYMNAVTGGDMGRAQRLVEKAAKEAGFTKTVYHGTQDFGFTKIDVSKSDDGISFFATDSLDLATSYSDHATEKRIGFGGASSRNAVAQYETAVKDYVRKANKLLKGTGIEVEVDDRVLDLPDEYGEAWSVVYDFASYVNGEFSNKYHDYLYESLFGDDPEDFDSPYGEKLRDTYEQLKKEADRLVEAYERYYNGATDYGNYKLYANTDGFLEIDADGASWHSIPVDKTKLNLMGTAADTRAIASEAKRQGYPGVIIRNLFDYGGHDQPQWQPENVYIFLDPQTQVKSADPVTYDDNGDVIPLSERFNTGNDDLRYSERDLPADVTVRDYLAEMEPTERMNETEKLLLKRYKETLGKLQEAERNAAEQDEIIKTAPFRNPDGSLNDELTKAKNRYQIYRKQADRYARELGRAERNQGFASILATGQKIVGDYLANGSYNRIADATDALETEIKGLGNQLKAIGARLENASQGQRDAFNRGLFNQNELNAAAKQLKESYGSSMTIKAISNRLALAYGEMYADSGAAGAKRFAEAARDLAEDILRTSKYRYHSEALNLIAEEVPTISLTETDEQEIKNAGLTISQYKRGIAPYVRVAEGASDLSSYVTNAQSYGGQLMNILGTDVEGNLAMALYNTIQHEKAEESAGKLEGMNEAASLGVIMADIAGANIPMGGNSDAINYLRNELLKQAGESDTTIKAVEDAIKSAKLATARASEVWRKAVKEVQLSEDAIEYYRALDEQRRLMELADQKRELTEQLKSKAAEKIHKEVEKQRAEYREREQRAREYRKGREELKKIRKRIGRNVKTINTLRVRETDQKHVPQQLQHVADLVMQTFTDSSLGRLAFPEQKLLSLGRTYRMLQELESDVTYFWDDEIEADIENLQALGEAYSALKNKDGNVPSHLSVEGVAYETEILMGVDHIVANVLNMIDATNDNFLKDRNDTFNEYAFKTGEELRKHKDYKLLRGKAGEIQNMLDETLRTGNMTPIFYFEQLRNQGLKGVFDEIRKGQSKYAKIIAEAKRFEESTKAKYNYGSWVNDGKLKMKTGQGHMIELTREEAAELYAIAKREKANKLYQTEHLLYGGFQYRSVAEKLAEDKTTTVKNTPNQLDEADIAKISNWLTEEQRDYADAMVGYLSTNMAAYGNEASMAMYGYKKFNETYYIPFNTVADQRYLKGDEGPQGENAGTGRIKNSGFTKKLQRKANQTLVVSGLTQTVNDHIHKMAAYAAMVEPTENLKRLLNYKVLDEDGTSNTVRALIGQKYGMPAEHYMTQLLKDINGATQSDKRAMKLVDKMVGAFKRGAVMSSLSVVLQQPTAMVRAMAYVSPKYFANNPFYRPSKGTWDEMMKYAGTAVIKDMGKFDVGLGLSATQYLGDEHLKWFEAYRRLKNESKFKADKAVFDRFMNWLTAAPGVADQWTWGLIWQAVKNEQAALNPGMDQSSEEFLEMCGERFDDVIDHSQVYDSVLTRSDLMRSQDFWAKSATAFMSEPTVSLNMLYHALTGPKGTKRGAIIGGVIASNVLAGALAALVQAWNDDDDKRNWLEKYADKASDNIIGNLLPWNMIPYISDIVSLFEGYDVERPDITVIADVIDYYNKFSKSFETGGPTWKQTENFVGTLVNLLGIPGKNISREIRRSWNAVFNTDWSAPNAFNVGQAIWGDEKAKDYYQRIVTALIRGENELAADYKAYVLASKGADDAKMTEGIRDAYKAAYEKGGIDKETAIQFLLNNGLATGETEAERKKSAFQYVDRWVEGTTNYSPYNTLKDAYKAINFTEIQKAWKEMTNNGYTDEQVKSQSRTLLKELVQDGTLTTGQATQLLKKWCPYKKDSDNTDKPKEWLKNKK